MILAVLLLLYSLGFFPAWFIAARFWNRRYRSDGDYAQAGVWGLLVAAMWPIFALGFLVGKAAA